MAHQRPSGVIADAVQAVPLAVVSDQRHVAALRMMRKQRQRMTRKPSCAINEKFRPRK